MSMKRFDHKSMSTHQLWLLSEMIAAALAEKIIAEKRVLEDRLRQLNRRFSVERTSETAWRRPYPTVFPKFRNPDNPSETWSGRGRQPRWLTAQIESGKQ